MRKILQVIGGLTVAGAVINVLRREARREARRAVVDRERKNIDRLFADMAKPDDDRSPSQRVDDGIKERRKARYAAPGPIDIRMVDVRPGESLGDAVTRVLFDRTPPATLTIAEDVNGHSIQVGDKVAFVTDGPEGSATGRVIGWNGEGDGRLNITTHDGPHNIARRYPHELTVVATADTPSPATDGG